MVGLLSFTSGRPTWHETWLDVADVISQRSQCARRSVGAVVVDSDNRLVATGYNGFPRGYSGVCKREEQADPPGNASGFDCPMVHAEANALLFADRRHVEGGTMYINALPCEDCAKLIANSGIARVIIKFTGFGNDRVESIMTFFAANKITAFHY